MSRESASWLPLRLLEEICFWKMQEREHTIVIRAVAPDLEPKYVSLLKQWEHVFAQTESISCRWKEAIVCNPQLASSPQTCQAIDHMLACAKEESTRFIAQLRELSSSPQAPLGNPLVQTVVQHIIHESEYFLCTLQSLTVTGMRTEPNKPVPLAEEPIVRLHVVDNQQARPVALTATSEGIWSADAQPVPIGGHRLPPLPYPYDALEPYIDAKTMQLHHDKHHKSYVDGLNHAELMLEQARKDGNFDLIKHWERELAFNGAGHYLHTLFWDTMKPGGGGEPTGALAEEIRQTFGSFDAFQKQFSAAAEKVEGSGWAILVWSPRSHRVEILQAEKHQQLSLWSVVPLLPLDVWEHAYYLTYQNDRRSYIDAWWNVVDWDTVSKRYEAAKQLTWTPY